MNYIELTVFYLFIGVSLAKLVCVRVSQSTAYFVERIPVIAILPI